MAALAVEIHVTWVDITLRDLLPEELPKVAWEGACTMGVGYFVLVGVLGRLLRPVAWLMEQVGAPLSDEAQWRLRLGIAAVIVLGLVVSAIWDNARKQAVHRKREELRMARLRKQQAEGEARRRALPPTPLVAPTPAVPPMPPVAPKPAPEPMPSGGLCAPPVRTRPTLVAFSPSPDPPSSRGDEADTALTEQAWRASTDPVVLLTHAIPRIPLRHTCLVLSQVAERLWLEWEGRVPKDWRPGGCLLQVRAWCFNEATLEDVAAAREEARLALHRVVPGRSRLASPYPAFAAVNAIRAVAQYPALEEHGAPVSLLPAKKVLRAFTSVICAKDTRAELAESIRRLVPFPARRSIRWIRSGSLVCAGDALLTLDGWRIARAAGS